MAAWAETDGGKLVEYLSVEPISQTFFGSVWVVVVEVAWPCGLSSIGHTLPCLSPGARGWPPVTCKYGSVCSCE